MIGIVSAIIGGVVIYEVVVKYLDTNTLINVINKLNKEKALEAKTAKIIAQNLKTGEYKTVTIGLYDNNNTSIAGIEVKAENVSSDIVEGMSVGLY